jgi:hypothetical protein
VSELREAVGRYIVAMTRYGGTGTVTEAEVSAAYEAMYDAMTAPDDSLDAAWQEAESLSEGWTFVGLARRGAEWEAVATFAPTFAPDSREWLLQYGTLSPGEAQAWIRVSGPTPAAALRALTSRFREQS